jgi:hypothetical protein
MSHNGVFANDSTNKHVPLKSKSPIIKTKPNKAGLSPTMLQSSQLRLNNDNTQNGLNRSGMESIVF